MSTVVTPAPPLVLLHASGMTSRQFARLTTAAEGTFTVTAPDLQGVGQTPLPDEAVHGPWTLDSEVRALLALLSSLPAPACVFGHSFGGLVAIEAALREPERFAALCLYEPVIVSLMGSTGSAAARAEVASITALMAIPVVADDDDGDDRAGFGARWVRGFVDWWNGAGAFDRLPEAARQLALDQALVSHRHVASMALAHVSVDTLRTLPVKTHFMIGTTSPAAARESVQLASATMPHATLEVIDGAGHMGPLTHAAIVNERVLDFFRAARS
jgi:pimeloyl-ACP methyl ester carboxylesterase